MWHQVWTAWNILCEVKATGTCRFRVAVFALAAYQHSEQLKLLLRSLTCYLHFLRISLSQISWYISWTLKKQRYSLQLHNFSLRILIFKKFLQRQSNPYKNALIDELSNALKRDVMGHGVTSYFFIFKKQEELFFGANCKLKHNQNGLCRKETLTRNMLYVPKTL